MKRFYWRIAICLIPVLISAIVVTRATSAYLQGEGGYRLGVDLVGGTILVYEVDESRMTDEARRNFKAEDLAAALKRRIDPTDLLSITIRPIPGNPPRVEIILPTGGERQAKAEQRAWAKVVAAVTQEYPVEGQEDPYGGVKVGDKLALADLVEKHHPKAKREDIGELIQKLTETDKGKRLLTAEQVEKIKELISQQGQMEFAVLANEEDDPAAIKAARDWISKNPEALRAAEKRGEPPPPPRNPEDGSLLFPMTWPGEPAHSYRWVELGKSELYSL